MLATFALTVLAWIFFRAESLGRGFDYVARIFSASLFEIPALAQGAWAAMVAGVFCLTVEWVAREHGHGLAVIASKWPRSGRWAVYYGLTFAVLACAGKPKAFIYFQF